MKILFIACYSPIINNSAAIETLQYLNKLCEMDGNEVHLLTVDFPSNSIYYDEELKSLMDSRIKVHLIDGGRIFNKFVPRTNLKDNSRPELNSSSSFKINLMKVLRKVKNSVAIPDMYRGFAKNGSRYAINLHRKEKFDVMFSMHEPPSSHLCALEVKKFYGDLPWITYWSDPWLKDSTRENSFFLKKNIEKNMEKQVVSLADKFVFVTEANRQDYIKTYGIDENKTFIITRGYDKRFYDKLSKEPIPSLIRKDKINILYAGEIFCKLRDINPFIKALTSIKDEKPEIYNKLNVLFFGNIDDAEAKEKLEDLSIASVSKRIAFNEAIKYMLNSEVLLLFGNKNSKQIPAKVYEYMGSSGKILTIYGDENDPLRSIVENNPKCTNTLNNTDSIKECLLNLCNEELKSRKLDFNQSVRNRQPDKTYEWSAIIERLNDILR